MWLISKALYESWPCSQALEGESSEDTCSDGEQSVRSSGSHTQLAYLQPDKMTGFSRLSRYGMTFRPLTERNGEDLLMWYREDFLARIYPVQEEEQELTASDQGCGSTWQELSVKYDLDSHSWRTHLCLWDEELQWSSVTLPKWGMTRSGALFQHPTAERPINGIGSGLWLTPRASDVGKGESNHTFLARMGDRTDSCAQSLAAQVNNPKTWPTPQASDCQQGGTTQGNRKSPNLSIVVKNWPTPTTQNSKHGSPTEWEKKNRPTHLHALAATRSWPTPQASDNRDRGNLGSGAIQRRKEKGKQIALSQSVSVTSGALNPLWVEWLMGWPLGWTDLKPLEMARFQSWQQQHSAFSQESKQ